MSRAPETSPSPPPFPTGAPTTSAPVPSTLATASTTPSIVTPPAVAPAFAPTTSASVPPAATATVDVALDDPGAPASARLVVAGPLAPIAATPVAGPAISASPVTSGRLPLAAAALSDLAAPAAASAPGDAPEVAGAPGAPASSAAPPAAASEPAARRGAPGRARVEPAARRRGLLMSMIEGISAQSHSALTGLGVNGNAITAGFALLLGADDVALGVLAAIPPLANITQLGAAAVAPGLAARKRHVAASSTLARTLWLACAALPFTLGFGPASLAAFLALFAVSCGLLAYSGNLWVSWMADLVPRRTRATYFSRRNNACAVAGIVVALAAGWTLDHLFGGVPRDRAALPLPELVLRAKGFALLFAVAACAGVTCGLLLLRQAEPARAAPPPEAAGPRTVRDTFIAPFVDAARTPGLRGFLLFVGVFGFTNGFAAPFWSPYMLEQLRLPYTTVNGSYVIVQGAAVALSLPVWGHLARRFGNRVVMLIALCLISTHPLYYMVASAEHPWPIWFDQTSSGLSWAGYNLAVFNLALGLSTGPRPERTFAVYATIAGLSQALSSALSGLVVEAMPRTVDLLGHALDRRQVVFLWTHAARLGCIALFLRALPQEPGGTPLRVVFARLPYVLKSLVVPVRGLPDGR